MLDTPEAPALPSAAAPPAPPEYACAADWYRDRYVPPPAFAGTLPTVAEAIARDFGSGLEWHAEVRPRGLDPARVDIALIDVLKALGTAEEVTIASRGSRWQAPAWRFVDGSRIGEPMVGAWEVLDRYALVEGVWDLDIPLIEAAITAFAAVIEQVVGPPADDGDHTPYAAEWYEAGFRAPEDVRAALRRGQTDPRRAWLASLTPSG